MKSSHGEGMKRKVGGGEETVRERKRKM